MAIIIIGGSLYPFTFHQPFGGVGPVRTLLATLTDRPGRGDFLANILLYMPFGFFLVRSMRAKTGLWARILLAILAGAALSIAVELAQYYDEGRESTATDVYSNVLGAALGAVAGCIMGIDLHRPALRDLPLGRVPLLLLAAWLGYRLFPYVPAIDLHKYWDALKPLVLHPSLTAYDLFRHSVVWFAVGALVGAVGGQRHVWLLFPLFAGAVLFAKVLIISTVLSVAEVAGAGVALLLLVLLAGARLRVATAAVLLGIYVVALRLQPFQFHPYPSEFGWIPFRSFVHGSVEVNVMSFLEKFFLYGSLIWLLAQAGLRLWLAAALVSAVLFVTSWIQVYLPERSAEITDAVMAIVIAVIIAVFDAEAKSKAAPGPRPMTRAMLHDPRRTQGVDSRN